MCPCISEVNKRNAPTRNFENALWKEGKEFVVGIDEVGRGAWAGPLTILQLLSQRINDFTESEIQELLNGIERESLFEDRKLVH